MAWWVAVCLISALFLNLTTCRMADPHLMLATSVETQALQMLDVGAPNPSSPTAPLSSDWLGHHSHCVVVLLVLSLLAVPLARSVAIAIPQVMCRSQRTMAPLLPPP